MERNTRKNQRRVIAINPETGERKEFPSLYLAAKFFGSTHATIIQALDRSDGSVGGWNVYDTPDRMRERIEELLAKIDFLEG